MTDDVPDREFWAASDDEDEAAVGGGINIDEDESEQDWLARVKQEPEALDLRLTCDDPEEW